MCVCFGLVCFFPYFIIKSFFTGVWHAGPVVNPIIQPLSCMVQEEKRNRITLLGVYVATDFIICLPSAAPKSRF